VTQYDVANTLGMGEHQGISLVGFSYDFDRRFPWNQPGLPLPPWRKSDGTFWQQGDGTVEREQFTLRMSNPAGELQASPADFPVSQTNTVTDSAACNTATPTGFRQLYNHGRSLAVTIPPNNSYFATNELIPAYQLDTISAWIGRGPPGAEAQALEQTRACLELVRDGYCDTVCGNCSYVLPETVGMPRSADDPGGQFATETVVSWGDPSIPGCEGLNDSFSWMGSTGEQTPLDPPPRQNWVRSEDGATVWYVGGARWYLWHAIAGPSSDVWLDPFTHCLVPGDDSAQQAAWYPYSGKLSGYFGHNSNSDAEAELRQFAGCKTDPAAALNAAWFNSLDPTGPCSSCGYPHVDLAEPTQFPCLDRTNQAASRWSPTADRHNVTDEAVGRGCDGDPWATCDWGLLPKPPCLDDPNRLVFGM